MTSQPAVAVTRTHDVGVGVGVGVNVAVAVGVKVAVAVGVKVAVAVGVNVAVAVAVGVDVDVAVAVGVGVGLGQATLTNASPRLSFGPFMNPIGVLAGARDIRSQKELEEQLRSQQFYTRSLIESNIDALMTTDPLGIVTDVNEQMEALTGATREELVGSPFKSYFTDPALAENGIRLVLSEGKVTNYELTARAKDGNETVVSYNASTFFDRDGRLQGVFAAARDVNEQKELEEQLREQQLYLRGLIEASVDGLITVDPDGYITDINDRASRPWNIVQ